MKLSRFDKALALNRQRIDRVYRGRPGSELRELLCVADGQSLSVAPGCDA